MMFNRHLSALTTTKPVNFRDPKLKRPTFSSTKIASFSVTTSSHARFSNARSVQKFDKQGLPNRFFLCLKEQNNFLCRSMLDNVRGSGTRFSIEEIKEDYSVGARNIGIFFLVSFVGLGYILTILPETAPTSESVTGLWKLGLILAHILPFALIPVGMRVFFEALPTLQTRPRFVYATQLGLAFIMVSIGCEIGWHVTQSWFYANDFTMLNFMFYYFMITGMSIWADGLIQEDTWKTQLLNVIFALLLVATCVLYPIGAENDISAYKIPIYVALTVVNLTLTYRGYRLLDDWRVILFPILSIGVNLYFVSLLDEYQDIVTLNALFHILHDVLGTEAGLAWFIWLFYRRIPQNT